MSGRILQFEAHRHGEAMRLLPWLVNGRLDEAERGWLEQHVAGCAECRQEITALRELQSACRAPDSDGDDAPGAERGWQRLQSRLQPLAMSGRRPAQGGWHRPRWQRWAIAAQAAVIAILAVVLWRQPEPAAYHTLGAASPAKSGNLVIVFDPRTDESRMRRLLLASQARIVDGPNDAGAYVLAVPPARLPMIRDALRAAPGVTLVATLASGASQ
jgi:anti-sigma-K factor RskA